MKKRVAFIGAGKVAWHLSHVLHEKGYMIFGISSRKKSSAKKLASRFGAEFTSQPEDIVKNADIIFITKTPDSVFILPILQKSLENVKEINEKVKAANPYYKFKCPQEAE